MPFSGFKDFEDCVSKNQDKDSPEGFCAFLHKKITGKHPSKMEMTGDIMNSKKELMSEIKFLTEEIDKKENPIQANPANVLSKKVSIDEPNVPKDKEPDKADLLIEICKLESVLKECVVIKSEAKTVRGFESPEPGDIPEHEKDILASAYASCREDGNSKERCSKIAWGAVKKARK